jgi:hypothetical protein
MRFDSSLKGLNTGKPRKTCAEVAGRRTFRILTSSQQPGNYSIYDSSTHTVTQYTAGNKNTYRIITQYTKDRPQLAAVPQYSNFSSEYVELCFIYNPN